MTNKNDIRWIQRFNNYCKAMKRLSDAVELSQERPLTDLEKQGLIQAFEFTHELAWNVMKDFAAYQGNYEIHGSRDASREAFKQGLVNDGHVWMKMIESRNKTSHTYDEETAEEIVLDVINSYIVAFVEFKTKMQQLKEKEENL